jgi:hypothetical protein
MRERRELARPDEGLRGRAFLPPMDSPPIQSFFNRPVLYALLLHFIQASR